MSLQKLIFLHFKRQMKKLMFIFIVLINSLVAFAQSDSVSSNAAKEANSIDLLAKFSDSQKTEVLKILQDYYLHKEDIVKTKAEIVQLKENLKNMTDLVSAEEQNFDENLKYILTQHQWERCSQYFKERKEKLNKANGILKKPSKKKGSKPQGS